jgi:hypothetical protein
MKNTFGLAAALLLAAAIGTAQEAKTVDAEVVSVDTEGKTITVKRGEEGEHRILGVDEKALAGLKDVAIGSKVVLTCKPGTEEPAPAGAEGAAATPCVVTDIAPNKQE